MTEQNTQFPEPKVNLPQVLPDLMKQYLDKQLTANLYKVLVRRRKLQSDPKWTLGKIGQELGYSRERARQVQAIAFKRLHSAFMLRKPAKMPIDNEVLDEFAILQEVLLAQNELSYDVDLCKVVEDRYQSEMTPEEAAHIRVLFEVAGFELIDLPNCDLIWKSPKLELTPQEIRKIALTSVQVLRRGAIPLSLKALVAKLPHNKKTPRPSESVVQFMLKANRLVEELPDGRYQVHFSKLKSAARYAYRILWETWTDPNNLPDPMFSPDLVKRVNELLQAEGGRPLTKGTLVNAMTHRPEMFFSMGKSGYWGLAEWKEKKDTISKLVMDCIEQHKRPCHISEILEYVKKSQPKYDDKTIMLYLTNRNGLFVRVAPDFYQPKSWVRPVGVKRKPRND
jgi:Sigma-70, region 4